MTDWITHDEMLAIPAQELSSESALPPKPVVSVVMMTRNHQPYLRQAVESVARQACDFPIELLIGEDDSSDETRAICEELQKQFPHLIRLVVSEKNVGITANFLRLVTRARGRYIALLEGDDYWTVLDKLQRQVELMETHPDYAWCGARTMNKQFWVKVKPYYELADNLRRYIVHTSSVMFRSACLERWPAFPDLICLDNLLFAYLSEQGKCGFIDQEMSYYRRHLGGVWSGADAGRRLALTWDCIDAVDSYFDGRFKRELSDRELWIYRMDTTIHLNQTFWSQWFHSLNVLRSAFGRTAKAAPLRFLLFSATVVLQPLATTYWLLRRRLALRQCLARLARASEIFGWG